MNRLRVIAFGITCLAVIACDKKIVTKVAPVKPEEGTALSYAWLTRDAKLAITNNTAGQIFKFDNKVKDSLGEYDANTGFFSPKSPGLYQITATITLPGPWTAGDYCKLAIMKSRAGTQDQTQTLAVSMSVMPTHQNQCAVTVSGIFPLDVGDGIAISALIAGNNRETNALVANPYNFMTVSPVMITASTQQ